MCLNYRQKEGRSNDRPMHISFLQVIPTERKECCSKRILRHIENVKEGDVLMTQEPWSHENECGDTYSRRWRACGVDAISQQHTGVGELEFIAQLGCGLADELQSPSRPRASRPDHIWEEGGLSLLQFIHILYQNFANHYNIATMISLQESASYDNSVFFCLFVR